MTDIRGASTISDEEFLIAYNNTALNNMGVLNALSTDWTAVGVKLRSERLTLHCTVLRSGGRAGNWQNLEKLPAEADIWLRKGVLQPKPKTGSYQSLASRGITVDQILGGSITDGVAGGPNDVGQRTEIDAAQLAQKDKFGTAAPTEGTTAPAATTAAASTATTTESAAPATGGTTEAAATSAPAAAAPAKDAFKFTADIFGTTYRFEGPDRDAAQHALFLKLRELNFSKVQITDNRTGRVAGLNEIVNGGQYKFSKQLTAAGGDTYAAPATTANATAEDTGAVSTEVAATDAEKVVEGEAAPVIDETVAAGEGQALNESAA